jgi:hypothetical protein
MTTPDVIALLTQLTTSISSLRADAAVRDARFDAQLAELRADAAARDVREAARDVREAAMNERLRSLHALVDADLSPSSPSPAVGWRETRARAPSSARGAPRACLQCAAQAMAARCMR